MPRPRQVQPEAPIPRPRPRSPLRLAFLVPLAAYFVCLPLALQSLWYDEMFCWHFYIRHGPLWIAGLGAPPPSQAHMPRYLPNNHILNSQLAWISTQLLGLSELSFRLPAMLAGAAFGLALAWPLLHRRKSDDPADPGASPAPARVALALLIALIGSLHPWLLSFASQGRGYALLLLLTVVATNLLPARRAFISWPYVAATTAAVYTIPIAAVAVVGNGVAQLLLRRSMFATWLRSAVAAALFSTVLYSPLLTGMREYFAKATAATMPVGQFYREIFEYLIAGRPLYQPAIAAAAVAAALLLLVVGSVLAYRRDVLRPALITFWVATVITLLLPLVLRGAGEVRFALWPIPLTTVSLATILSLPFLPRAGQDDPTPAPARPFPRRPALVAAAVALALLVPPYLGLLKYPLQPVREALARTQQLAPPDAILGGVSLTAAEALATYPTERPFEVVESVDELERLEDYHRPVWLVVFFPQLLATNQPELAAHVRERYTVAEELPTRGEPVQILKPAPSPR